jgi:mercuric ion transport protein
MPDMTDAAARLGVRSGEDQPIEPGARQNLIAAGGILASLGAASCCIVPLALFMAGVSGAWIGNLTALAPYQPVFAAAAFGFLGYGFYLVYRKPKAACADGSYCAAPRAGRTAKIGLWTATGLILAALTFSYWFPLFIET